MTPEWIWHVISYAAVAVVIAIVVARLFGH